MKKSLKSATEFLNSKKGKMLFKKKLNSAKKITKELNKKRKVDPKTMLEAVII